MLVSVTVRRERRWTPAGATPARNWFAPHPERTCLTASTTSPNPKPSRQTTITACRERSTARTNSTWLSSRSGGTPNTARIRSYASSGRRGRSAHELEIVGGKQTRNRDCFFLTAVDAFVCPAIAQPPSWLIQNRPDWLPFKSALTAFQPAAIITGCEWLGLIP